MGEIISILSGKGGTGKTTICAAVAVSLARLGKQVLCIDADIGLRNLDIALGMSEQSVAAFTELLRGDYTLADAAAHPSLPNLRLLTAPVRETADAIDPDAFLHLLEQARAEFDFCLIDAPAGIGPGFQLASRFADRCLIVSTSDPASMRDAGRTADLLTLAGNVGLLLIVNRVSPRMFTRMKLTVDDIMDNVGLPLIGLVPEDRHVPLAAAQGVALPFSTRTGAAEACRRIACRLSGEPLPLMKL